MMLASAILLLALSGSAIDGLKYHRSEEQTKELARPHPELREASATRAAAELGDRWEQLRRTSYWVVASNQPLQTRFVSRGDEFDASFQNPDLYNGQAVALTEDGYLLTAAHMVRDSMCVIGWSEGRQRIANVRVVYVQRDRRAGAECAIIKAEGLRFEPVPWGGIGRVHQKLYASAWDAKPRFRRMILDGEVSPLEGSVMTALGRVLATTIPFYHGDSGGGVFDADGRLVGVITAYLVPWDSENVSRLIFVPDRNRIMAIVDADRARLRTPVAGTESASHSNPPQENGTTPSSVGSRDGPQSDRLLGR